ncbi:MAG: hypothetical protein F4169_19800 [Gammaproteobacteria bacterium]|nr:hypothetical protein [Gemmatimonadota bacterium]MYF31050.1 hypothetical protein [Gammaproteobacteria bacterium]
MANVQNSLKRLMDLDGAIGVALVDLTSGMTLGYEGGGNIMSMEAAGAGNLNVVRAKMQVMKDLDLKDKIEDILITLGKQYHLIRPLNDGNKKMFLYLAISKAQGNLGMARYRLQNIESELEV